MALKQVRKLLSQPLPDRTLSASAEESVLQCLRRSVRNDYRGSSPDQYYHADMIMGLAGLVVVAGGGGGDLGALDGGVCEGHCGGGDGELTEG